ncbi:hypothetical protein [Polaromonas sp. JS666]|uniref:hypothetical protein n=1 Tax=Polaromonas sp. (strain JS666 / ATCC BAA-500) TaxID=296591 RepID=UPI0000464AD9|nr:hypothetical protein [Polaromonas sp. JS666]UUZ71471.1 hypothetical protein LP415_21095 [Polaromonas sp. P1(28)-8]
MTARRARKAADAGRPHTGPASEDEPEDDDGLELPVTPDEGAPLIPDDDERVINVPS